MRSGPLSDGQLDRLSGAGHGHSANDGGGGIRHGKQAGDRAIEGVAVDVVHWDLSRHHDAADRLIASLSEDERHRAGRLVLPLLRRRAVLARGLLRHTLGRALGADPAALRFARGGDGKPSLVGANLAFSLSHADNGLLIAMARGIEVGCDLEALRSMPAAGSIAGRWFSRSERDAMAGLSGEALDRAFLSCWVRKEAVLKAIGTGFQAAMDFTAGFATAAGEEQVVTTGDRRFWLVDLAPAPGWLAAVAAQHPLQATLHRPVAIDELPRLAAGVAASP